jgi:hypothetical protein
MEHWMRELASYLNEVSNFKDVSLFRGQADSSWKLLPSLARLDKSKLNIHSYMNLGLLETHIMRNFEKYGLVYLSQTPNNELEWLIHAQHHGLPTRLLDWTTNPLKALFFSVENPEHDNVDGVVYAVEPLITYVMERFVKTEKIKNIIGFHSSSLNPRVTAQEGCFTLNPKVENWDEFIEIRDGKDTGIRFEEFGIRLIAEIAAERNKKRERFKDSLKSDEPYKRQLDSQ